MLTYFQDPRYRQERIMWAVVLPLTLLALVGVGIMAISKQKSFEEPIEKTAPQQKPVQMDAEKIRPAEKKKAEPTPGPEPKTPNEIIAAAVSSFQTGNVERANTLMAGVDLEKAGSPLGWEVAGLLSENSKNREEAHRIYTRGISAVPTASLFYRRALLNRENADPEPAIKDFNEAIRRAPTDIVISNVRLLYLIRIGRGQEVRKELESFNPRKQDAACWIFAQSALAMEEGNYDLAAQFLTEAKRSLDPRIFELLLNDPVISRNMTRPEVMPFFIQNIGPQ